MKFINYLEGISGIGIAHLLTSFVFIAFFIGILWYVIKMDKHSVEEKSNLPLN